MILPESGAVIPMIIRIVVVLPAPLGPSIPRISPARAWKETFLTTCFSPKDLFVASTTRALASMRYPPYYGKLFRVCPEIPAAVVYYKEKTPDDTFSIKRDKLFGSILDI